MSSRELVSVVVPAYNHELYVGACLESIVSQTHRDLELLIIDDGSTDSTNAIIGEVIDSNETRFERVVHISRQNKGKAQTLNELLGRARSEYVFLLDSDDTAKPEAIATLFGFLSHNHQYALAAGDNEIIDSSGNRVYWDRERRNIPDGPDVAYRTFADFLRVVHPDVDFGTNSFGAPRSFIRGNYIPNGQLFRVSAIRTVGGYKDRTLEDWYINSKLASRYKIAYIDEILASYRWHDGNAIKNGERMAELTARTKALLEQDWYPRTFRLRAAVRRTGIGRVRYRINARLRDRHRG